MKIGFTGTRHGMTDRQHDKVIEVLKSFQREHGPVQFHHGDCVGADTEAASIIRYHLGDGPVIVCHPPVDESHRAHNPHWNAMRPAKTHFARNRDIVDETEVLVAAPYDMTEQPKGGTWYTVNYARKKGKPVYIVWPDGTVSGPE